MDDIMHQPECYNTSLFPDDSNLQVLSPEIFSGIESQGTNHFKLTQKNYLNSSCKINEEEAVIQLLNKILSDAASSHTSDIHLEPYSDHFRIRFRQDGLLADVCHLNLELARRISIRIKILSNLDISEKRFPQDGRLELKLIKSAPLDLRISTCPTLHGEKIVIRLLNSESDHFDIDTLGLEPVQYETLMKIIHKPQGMILITGPTGSGKTLSLYAILKHLNSIEKNIITIEDPVEIQLPGINQMNVNLKIDLSFSKLLRAILRQDPDIIMLGEIRDFETADVAIRAAQTGHLVLSTLHTNHSIDAIDRLINLGIQRFNIANTINLLIAQRLVRRLCDECKTPESLFRYKAKGCTKCINGYRGRIGIFEVVPLCRDIKELLLSCLPLSKIEEYVNAKGIPLLYEAGLTKVKEGLTTIEEINRVIGLPELSMP